jgi:hypothetical protein
MEVVKHLKNRAILAGMSVFLVGCGSSDFNYGKVHSIIEGSPLHLDAEYVTLKGGQVDCGVEQDLWDAPVESGQRMRQIARLKQAGRDLKFSDDVSIGDMNHPYVQVRGDFSLSVNDITSDKDGPEPNTRLVITKMGIIVPHACFPDPLPLMGVRKGNFAQDVSPVLLFRYNNAWTLEGIVH